MIFPMNDADFRARLTEKRLSTKLFSYCDKFSIISLAKVNIFTFIFIAVMQ